VRKPSGGPAHGSPSSLSVWIRTHRALAALVPVVVAGVAIVTAVVFGAGHPAGRPAGSASAPPLVASAVTRGSKWLGGSDAKSLTAVNADLGRVSAAVMAGKQGTARTAGARLAADAAAALGGPMPPVDAGVYRSALTDLEAAGRYAASGETGKALRLLKAGQAGIMKVTAAADMPVPVKTPAVPEPNS
jgi:hypothetical protein